jgi:hypothetical protein
MGAANARDISRRKVRRASLGRLNTLLCIQNSRHSNHRMGVAHLHESHRTLRDGSFGVALSQALRARLRSHRPSGTFRNKLTFPYNENFQLAKECCIGKRQK